MQNAARVLIVGETPRDDSRLRRELQSHGFESLTGDISKSAEELAGAQRPDVVVLNMNSPEAQSNPAAFFALAQTLKQTKLANHMRILLVGANKENLPQQPTDLIDDLLLGPTNGPQICHRIKALVRLNTMHEELVRRIQTTEKYGIESPSPKVPSQELTNIRILFMGNPTSFVLVEEALASSATLIGALTFSTAFDYLNREKFDSILLDAGTQIEPYLHFVEELRKNSRFYNLPIIMMVDHPDVHALGIYETGVTDILKKPIQPAELCLRIDALVREYRFRNTLKDIYQESRHLVTNDALTGLYNRGFMYQHLSAMIQDYGRSSQSFSVVALKILNMPEINKKLGYASGDRIIRQVGEVIGLLVRGEDVAVRFGGQEFMIVLPDTDPELAKNVIVRIRGVIEHTEFALENCDEPVVVQMKSTLTGYSAGDDPEGLVARAWSAKALML